jgi:acyl carrier protein
VDRQTLRTTLLELLQLETFESLDGVTDDTNLRTGLKIDSVDLLSMALHAERKFGIAIDSDDFETVKTVGDLLNLLQAKIAAQAANPGAKKVA